MQHFIGNRFRILSELGQGGMGTVYRVADTLQDDREVALKTIRTKEGASADFKLRFQEEFRAMVKLRHPNTLEVFDYGQLDDETRYLTMEIVSGRSLSEIVSDGPLETEDAAKLLIPLLQALGFIHSRRYVHRDIKAENIRIRDDGTLKLMDFGLMEQMGLQSNGKLTGTPGYLPPEVAKGGTIDARSDLYSVGCLAFELVTGQLPFEGTLIEVVKAHINEPPPLMQSYRSGIPEHYERIVRRLLEKDQLQRYQDATEVIADLADLTGVQVPRESVEQKKSYLLSSALVGRQSELQQLEAALRATQRGTGQSLFVGAPAGIGKSRLVHELTLQAKLEDVPVLHGQCLELDMAPYEPLAQALRPVIALSNATELERFGPVLIKILPEFAKFGFEAAPALETILERQRIQKTVLDWLGSVTERKPLVLFFDDLHWIDPHSLEVFNYCIRHAKEHRLFCLATFRNDEASPSSPLWYTIDEGLTRYLKLTAFDLSQVQLLLQAMLRKFNISPEFNQFLFDSTAGNAFFLAEVLRYLVEENILTFEDGTWQFPEHVGNLVLPTSVEATIMRRLDQLSACALELAQVAAVLGRYQDLDRLLAISGLDENALFASLDELVERQFIHKETERYTFPHDRVRETLYQNMAEDRRRDLHQRCGEFLERASGDRQEAVINELAHHFSRGRDGSKAFRYLRMVGDQARRAGLAAVAIAHWKEAEAILETLDLPEKEALLVDLWWDIGQMCTQVWPQVGVTVLEKLLTVLEAQGNVVGTCRLLQQLIGLIQKLPSGTRDRILTKLSKPKVYKHRARRGLARAFVPPALVQRVIYAYGYVAACYGMVGHPMQGLARLKRALEILPFAGTPIEGGLLASTAVCLLPAGRFDDIQYNARRSLELCTEAEIQDNPALRTGWMGAKGAKLTISFQGYRPSQADLADALRGAEEGLEFSFKNYFWGRFAFWATWTGRHDEALELIEQMNQNSRKIGAPPYQWALYLRAYLYWQRGDFDAAMALAEQALRFEHVTDDAFARLSLITLRGQIHLAQGEMGQAERDLLAALDGGRQGQMLLLIIRALIGLGEVELVRGDLQRANQSLQEAYELSASGPGRNPLHQAIAARRQAEVLRHEGRLAQARVLLDEAMGIVSMPEQDNLIEQAHLLCALGEWHVASGETSQAFEAYTQAAELYRSLQNRYLVRMVAHRIDSLKQGSQSPETGVKVAPPRKGTGRLTMDARWGDSLLSASAIVTSDDDYHQVALKTCLESFDAHEASLYLVDPELRWVASRGPYGASEALTANQALLEQACAEGKAIVAVDMPPELELNEDTNVDLVLPSVLIAPVCLEERVVGVLYLAKPDLSDPFDEASLDAITTFIAALAQGLTLRRSQHSGTDLAAPLRSSDHAIS